jgi:hypothetical protein
MNSKLRAASLRLENLWKEFSFHNVFGPDDP